MSPPRLGNVTVQWQEGNSNHFFCMFKHKRRRPHPRPLPAVSLLPSLIMKRSFPGNKTPWSRTRDVAVEVEEFPPSPAAVHPQYCRYCFPCVQGLAEREKDDESDFPFPSSLFVESAVGGHQVLQDFQGLLSKTQTQGQSWCVSISWVGITGFVPVRV